MNAVVLAGGAGKRMLPLTLKKPKAMVELKGKPLLEWLLTELKKAGIKKAVIVVCYKKEKIMEYFGSSFKGIQLIYAVQKKPLGTAHALLQAKKMISGKNFIVCHADVIPDYRDLRALIECEKENAMALRWEKNPSFFGVVSTSNGKIVSVSEKPAGINGKALVNAGVYKFTPGIFSLLSCLEKNPSRLEYELTDALKKIAFEKTLGFIVLRHNIMDISTPEELAKAELIKI